MSFSATDYVEFRYAASGQKVAKLVHQAGQPVQRTDYLGPYQYEGDSLRFFPHAEGRVLRSVVSQTGEVKYEREFAVKDHLGNLRLAYRLGQTPTYVATLEQDAATHARELRQFDDFSVSAPVAQNVGGLARTGQYAAKLNAGGGAPQPLGPLLQLGVQKGDVVTVTAPGRYEQPVSTPGFFAALGTFVANLLHPAGPTPPGPDPLGGRRGLPLLQLGVAAGLTALPQLGGGVPKGYLRVLVFNKDSALVDQQVRPMSQAALHGYEDLRLQVTLAQDGYVTAYVGNESDVDVLFDDVTVEHRQGLQVQENQYDPWGLSLAGLDYGSPSLKLLNQYQFGGKELETDLGLNMQDFGWRLFDMQLGRWHCVDQLASMYSSLSTYAFTKNNPILFQEIDGRYFDWSNLKKEERKELRGVINDLRKSDKVFNTIYNKLSASDAKFSLSINAKQKDPGTFTPDSKSEKGGAITFNSLATAKQSESTIEEFFHGFQNLFYGGKSKADKIGGSNMEVEPRFLKTFSSFHIQDIGSATSPGMEGLVSFVIGLSPDISSLSPQEKQQYLKSVEQFRRYYADRNKSLGINNRYDDPKTNNGPDAALEIIRATRNSK